MESAKNFQGFVCNVPKVKIKNEFNPAAFFNSVIEQRFNRLFGITVAM